MTIQVVPYSITIDHDGKKYEVQIPELSVPRCQNCGQIAIDDDASDQIDKAFRRTAGLLTPEEIRRLRIACGFRQQQEFAQCLGIGVSTLSRWETGSQVQQRFHDRMLRAFLAIPAFREYLISDTRPGLAIA